MTTTVAGLYSPHRTYQYEETRRVRDMAELYRELFGPDWRVEWNQTVRIQVTCED